jgi:hypothetical protein
VRRLCEGLRNMKSLLMVLLLVGAVGRVGDCTGYAPSKCSTPTPTDYPVSCNAIGQTLNFAERKI